MDRKGMRVNRSTWVNSAQGNDYWRALANAALNLRASYAIELISNAHILFNSDITLEN